MTLRNEATPYPASRSVLEKIESKHQVAWEEIEEVFQGSIRFEKVIGADQYGEPRFAALGKTQAGRFVTVLFVPQPDRRAKVVSARDMTKAERRRYGR